MLLLGCELDHAPTFGGITERGEDLPAYAEVWMVHMYPFDGFRKGQSEVAKNIFSQALFSAIWHC